MDKRQRKQAAQKKWGLQADGKIPMVLIPELDDHIQEILDEILDGIAAIGVQVLLVEPSSESGKEECQKWHDKHPESIAVIPAEDAKSDIFDLAVLEDVTVERLKELQDLKLVPVAEKGIEPFDPIEEKGNGFIYQSENPWTLLVALVRAAETYRFPYDWKNVIKALGKSQ